MKNLYIVIIIYGIFFCNTFAANQIDSLENALSKAKDKDRLTIMHTLTSAYWFSNPAKSLEYGKIALELSKKYNSLSDEGIALNDIGVTYLMMSDVYKCIGYLDSSMKIFDYLNDTLRKANTYRCLADANMELSNYDKAQENYIKAYKLMEKYMEFNQSALVKRFYGILLNNFGTFYMRKETYKEAINYFKLSAENSKSNKVIQGIAVADFNIGLCYFHLGDYQKSIQYFNSAMKIATEIGNKKIVSNSLQGLSNVYQAQKDYVQALNYLNKSKPYLLQLNDKPGLCDYENSMGEIYFAMNNYSQSLAHLIESEKISREIGDKQLQFENNNNLAKVYEKIGDYKSALSSLKKVIVFKRFNI